MSTIEAGGGILYRLRNSIPEILLIKRNGQWDLPKGKKEEWETIEQCAVREVAEETGIPLPHLVSRLTTTRHKYFLNGSEVTKHTYWFSMILNDDEISLTPQQEEGITDVQWVEAREALSMVGYENLTEVIERFLEKAEK